VKNLLASVLFASLSISTQVIASVDYHQVAIQNDGTFDSFGLTAIATRTEYRTEQVQSTCYDRVFDGYERVCSYNFNKKNLLSVNDQTDPPVGPHPAPGPHPRDPRDPPPETKPGRGGDGGGHGGGGYEPRDPVCREEARYRTVSYSCIETVSVPYQVYDHEAFANLDVKISATPMSRPHTPNCGIDFVLDGDYLSAINKCQEYIAVAQVTKNISGYSTNYSYDINLFNTEKVLAPLKGSLANMRVEGNFLVFKTGTITNANNVSLKLFIERNRSLASDITLINRKLTTNEFSYQAIDDKTGNVKINLNNLVGGLNDRKYTISVAMDVALPAGSILKGNSLPNLHQENSITKKR
jgi:hypothetical protein